METTAAINAIRTILIAIVSTSNPVAGRSDDTAHGDRKGRYSVVALDGWACYKVDASTLSELLQIRKTVKASANTIGFMEIAGGQIAIRSGAIES